MSVTTCLSNGVPKQGPLVGWAAKMVAEYVVNNIEKVDAMVADDKDAAIGWIKGAHYRAKKAAGLRGTDIHNIAEAFAKGEALPPVGADAVPYVQPLLDFLVDYKPEPILTEVTCFSLKHGYAGTLDSVAKFADPVLGTRLLDFKTSKGVYGETAMQLAAYRWADGWDNGTRELQPFPEVDGGLVVHIAPTGYALYLADIGEEVFEHFLAVKKVAHFTNDLSKQVLTTI